MKENPVDCPPSYSESLLHSSSFHSSLLISITETRRQLISALLTNHVHPHIHSSATNGLNKTTLALIPSNISSLHPAPFCSTDPSIYRNPFDQLGDGETFPGEKLINFPFAEKVSLIRLRGAENTLEFWRQPTVIRDLETQLKTELEAGGYRLVDEGDELNGNKASAVSTRNKGTNAEWRFVEKAAVKEGDFRVNVRIGDVALRIENAMGLFETRGGEAIVVKVEVGR